jgi:methionine-rich copper-binding protein CopC
VTASSPAAGATAVPLGTSSQPTPVTVTFSEDVTGVSASSVKLAQGTTAVAGAVSYDSASHTATLLPDAPLTSDTSYTVTLTSAIKSASGGLLTGQSWKFLTGPAPAVTARTPAAGATGVARTANITATFSEAVTGIPTTAAASSSFTIKQSSTGAAFASVAGYSTSTKVATLNPTGTLLAGTQYTVTLSSAVKDTAGNPLTTLSWTFTTGAV